MFLQILQPVTVRIRGDSWRETARCAGLLSRQDGLQFGTVACYKCSQALLVELQLRRTPLADHPSFVGGDYDPMKLFSPAPQALGPMHFYFRVQGLLQQKSWVGPGSDHEIHYCPSRLLERT